MASVSTTYQDLRIGGLATGIDTDSIMESLMKAEQAKVARIEQEKQSALWQQEAYRKLIDSIRDFTTGDPNKVGIFSDTGYRSVTTVGGTGAVSFIAGSGAQIGAHTINAVAQLATAASVSSVGECVGQITGSADLSGGPIALTGTSFALRLDGVQQTISFDADCADINDLVAALQQKVDLAFGAGRVTVGSEGGRLTLDAEGSILQAISAEGVSALPKLGIAPGARNGVILGNTAETVFGIAEDIEFSINGVSFHFTKDDTLTTIIREVNQSDAGVTLSYSAMTDGFTLRSNQTGAASQIVIENTSGGLFGADGALGIDTGTVRNGQDAVFYLNDPDQLRPIYRSENIFTIDGVTLSLKAVTDVAVTYTVADDVNALRQKIMDYVEEYNGLLEQISSLVSEKRDYDMRPLTDAEKEEMSETEIAKWEEKAKKGLLRADSLLGGLYHRLRMAFSSQTEGAGSSFAECGITTSLYTNKGKLVIDEKKLTAALEKDADAVMALFTKESGIGYTRDLTSEEAAQRYEECGFAHRINDIFMDHVSTRRNAAGLKGILLEKAGLIGDVTEFSNAISKNIEKIDRRIEQANRRMDEQEDKYWRAFAALEEAVNTMNSQSSWITSMMGQG
ncbi:MAG: flagellar filament capping protein FliD [Clostridiales bacterium]|nr:flagellar filament capping protein FliD [Clostridiales bacterium]